MVTAPARLLRGRPRVLALIAVGVAAALVVTLLTTPWVARPDEPQVADPGPGDRVLQSVTLAVQNDGSLASINDTAVISRAQGGATDTVTATYDPAAVVDQLPVRLLTSYRTEEKAGTNLGDLTGYTGRVTIDLTVENLTVKPQQLTYDVAGRKRTSTAVVGAPLTVVASAALPGTDPSTVITNPAQAAAADETTNGVLSRSPDDTTQVQWATILAPPQLDATARLRLVLDAENFTVPTVDLSVQPGLVTDPSVGALVDAAFNPRSSEELELESRTISLIGEVNAVLGRASDAIVKVRRNLDTTSETLGTKTVSSLKTSTATVASSLRASRDNVRDVGRDLNSSLKSTNSETLARMSETVSQLEGLLGDTSAQPSAPRVRGSGCQQKVAAPDQGDSVYADLLQVVSQLDGYAGATGACKEELRRTILTSIGPQQPTKEACAKASESVTCSLAGVEASFAAIAGQFVADSEIALDRLDPSGLDPVTKALGALVTQLGGIGTAVERFDGSVADARETLDGVAAGVAAAEQGLTALSQAVDGLHDDAVANRDEVLSMQVQNNELAGRLCDLIGDPTEPGKLSRTQVDELRAYLTQDSCADEDGATVPLAPPAAGHQPMATRLNEQTEAWRDVATQTDTDETERGTGLLLARLGDQLDGVGTGVDRVRSALKEGDESLEGNMNALRARAAAAQDDLRDLQARVNGTKNTYTKVKTDLNAALRQAGKELRTDAQRAADPAIKRVTEQGQASSRELAERLERSSRGLSRAADTIRRDGSRTLREQRRALDHTTAGAARSIDATTERALSQVSRDVTASSRDLGATRALLARDLANVLVDLGNPKVRGSGVLGSLATSAKAAGSADFQLGLATDRSSSYASVRGREVGGILLRQAQAEAALERQADLPTFVRQLPDTTEHRTVYLFHLAGGR